MRDRRLGCRVAIPEIRRIGAMTERERDYVEAVASHYKDFSTRPERERQGCAMAEPPARQSVVRSM